MKEKCTQPIQSSVYNVLINRVYDICKQHQSAFLNHLYTHGLTIAMQKWSSKSLIHPDES